MQLLTATLMTAFTANGHTEITGAPEGLCYIDVMYWSAISLSNLLKSDMGRRFLKFGLLELLHLETPAVF